MVKGIVFDFDGVIVHSEPLHFEAFMRVVRPLGVALTFQDYAKKYLPLADHDIFLNVCNDAGVSFKLEQLPHMLLEKTQYFNELWRGHMDFCPGVLNIIKQAQALNVPLAICSNSYKHDIESILRTLGSEEFAQQFVDIISADEMTNPKPDPEGYLLATQRVGVNPGECWAIEDSPLGMTAAKRAGLRVIGVTTTYTPEDLKQADRVVNSLEEIVLTEL